MENMEIGGAKLIGQVKQYTAIHEQNIGPSTGCFRLNVKNYLLILQASKHPWSLS